MKNLKRLLGRKTSRKPKDPNAPTPGLEQAKFAFKALANVGDGAINIPGLKAAAQLVVQIIETVQKVESNKADCTIVAERACQLVNTAFAAVGGRTEPQIEDRLKQNIDRLAGNLEDILKILKNIASSSIRTRMMNPDEHHDNIVHCKEMLDQAFKIFNVDATIGIQLDINEIKQNLVAMKLHNLNLTENLHVSSTPPPAPEIFFGRDKFVADTVFMLQTMKPTRLAILGAGGMGKTAVALVILHHEKVKEMFQSNRYFVPCEAAVTPNLLVKNILQVLNVQISEKEDSLTTLHKCLVLSGPMLLTLDNFESPWEASGTQSEVQDILCRIASVEHVSIVVTMRANASPSGIKWSQSNKLSVLPPLEPEAALTAFLTANPDADDGQSNGYLKILLHEMDYVPLAIILMAQVGKGEDCAHLLQRWTDERTSMLQTQGSLPGRLCSVDVSISISIKSSNVAGNPEAVKLLAVVCQFPDGLPRWKERLQKIVPEFQHPWKLVAVLLQATLAYDEAGTLKVLSPIRHYMLANHPAELQHMLNVEQHYMQFIAEYATTPFGPLISAARATLQLELGNITHIVRQSIHNKLKEEMVEAVYQISAFFAQTSPSIDLLLDVMPHLDDHNMSRKKPKFYQLMGNILFRQDKYPEARIMLLEAQKQFTQVDNQNGAAQCLQSLGNILRMQGRYSEATEMLLDAQKQFTKFGSQLRAAQCLHSLGVILRMQGRYSEATEKFLDAQKQFTEIRSQLGAAQCLQCLGDILKMQGKYSDATEMLLDAQKKFTEIGSQLGVAQCLHSLGNILRVQGKYSEATEMLLEAQKQFNEIRSQLGAAQCLQSLGDIMRMQGKYSEATEMLLDAEKQFTEMGSQLGAAQCLKSLGNIMRMQGKYAEATEMLLDAKKQCIKIGNQFGEAQCLQSLGAILRIQGKYSEATEMLLDAQKQFTEIGSQLGVAQCLQSRDDILRMQDKYSEATEILLYAQK